MTVGSQPGLASTPHGTGSNGTVMTSQVPSQRSGEPTEWRDTSMPRTVTLIQAGSQWSAGIGSQPNVGSQRWYSAPSRFHGSWFSTTRRPAIGPGAVSRTSPGVWVGQAPTTPDRRESCTTLAQMRLFCFLLVARS
ncbi:hypothetical protein [Micromonospora fulviviridis]|uniref:hypothetical protein n=1 Tax=Micromonospora fulviviridis TaxID=47860 RepID=UPI0037BA3F64